MAFLEWSTTETVGHPIKVVIHEFIGPRRLPRDAQGVEQDEPSLDAPMVGTGSLAWHMLAPQTKGTCYRTNDGGTRSGWLRTQWNIQAPAVNPGGNLAGFGMYCYASQSALLLGQGQCYLVAIRNNDHAREVAIYKSRAGVAATLDTPPSILLALSSQPQWELWQTFNTRLTWKTTEHGVRLTYEQTLTSDLDVFTPILEVEDTTDLFPSTMQQGFWVHNESFNHLTAFMDETQGRLRLAGGLS